MTTTEAGLLVLAGTPIGDAADASPALVRALAEADVIAAEDTRRLRDLCRRLGVEPAARVVSYFDGNEASRTGLLLEALRAGQTVLVATDAGMPSVSDPGFRVTAAAIEAGIRVTAVPGPSAVLTALALSGLPTDRFCFEGFVGRKAGERLRRLEALAAEERTMVFFEAPHRLAEFLAAARDVFGADRPAAVCRELTKTYEEVVRLPLGALADWAAGEVRGEITVVVAGASAPVVDEADAVGAVLARVAAGVRLKEAVAGVAAASGLAKGQLYDAAVAARREGETR